MSTTSLIRQAGEKSGFEYARAIAILDGWSSPYAWENVYPGKRDKFARDEAVRSAKSAARILRAARDRDGGTHFELAAGSGHVKSVEVAA